MSCFTFLPSPYREAFLLPRFILFGWASDRAVSLAHLSRQILSFTNIFLFSAVAFVILSPSGGRWKSLISSNDFSLESVSSAAGAHGLEERGSASSSLELASLSVSNRRERFISLRRALRLFHYAFQPNWNIHRRHLWKLVILVRSADVGWSSTRISFNDIFPSKRKREKQTFYGNHCELFSKRRWIDRNLDSSRLSGFE